MAEKQLPYLSTPPPRAYSTCADQAQAEMLLKDLEVRRTDNVLGGTRKVGASPLPDLV